jgi:hypothetical protein
VKIATLVLATETISSLLATGVSAKYKVEKVANGGAVQGFVKFDGSVPILDSVLIAKDNEVCGDGSTIPNPITVGDSGGLENTVVYLEKVKSGKKWPKQDYAVNQKDCAFEPYLQVVPKGAKMTIRNNDPVLHNVHPFEIIGDSRRTLFNLAQPKQNQENTKKIKTRKGNAVELACDAHSWMAGWLYVLEHPYYSVIGADGGFDIGNIPPGDYKLVAWHPVLGTQEQAISVGSDGNTDASFSFKSE